MTDTIDKPTTSPISTRKHGDVLDRPVQQPAGERAVDGGPRRAWSMRSHEAEADDGVKAVVIACEGQTFFAGADITEFGKPPQQPWLPAVVDTIENCSKPVVAAIHGTALGGGLEVALACHYRVADPSAKLGTPEVKLGLLPGAGGTQRLPRVAGVAKALEMCATGNPIGAKEGFECGLVDRLVEGELIPHAVGYAEEVRDIRPLPEIVRAAGPLADARARRVRRVPQGQCASASAVSRRRSRISRRSRPRPQKPYSEGVIEERKLFMELMGSEQSAAQRYFFFAERKAAKIEACPRTPSRAPIARSA